MDEQNKNIPFPEEDDWFKELLSTPEVTSDIGPDEHAVSSAGLSDIADMEFEKIMKEALAESWQDETSMAEDLPFLTDDEPAADVPLHAQDVSQPYLDMPQAEYVNGDEDIYAENYDEDYEDGYEEDYEGDFEDEEYDEEPVDPSAPVRKVRPKKKSRYGLFGLPHLASTAIWIGIILAIGVTLGRWLWICAADVLAFGREDLEVSIIINEQDDLDSITTKLYNAGLIQYPDLFKLYANLSDAEESISVGTFTLNTLYDYHALVNGLSASSSYREEVTVMIPEGYTCAQIFKLLEDKGVCSAAELEDYAANGALSERWFLEGVTRGDKYCLEGYLFPDTYRFYSNDKPGRVLEKLLSGFEARFSEEMIAYIDTLNVRFADRLSARGFSQEYIAANKLGIRQIVIIASMIEKESAGNAEGYTISSVIFNRLTNPGAYPFLNIDATIVYALGGKKDLTDEDMKLDHPYNTYLYPGLPPGPISNPSLASLNAAVDPDENTYYFYALNPATGGHHFTSTYAEHQEFLNSLR